MAARPPISKYLGATAPADLPASSPMDEDAEDRSSSGVLVVRPSSSGLCNRSKDGSCWKKRLDPADAAFAADMFGDRVAVIRAAGQIETTTDLLGDPPKLPPGAGLWLAPCARCSRGAGARLEVDPRSRCVLGGLPASLLTVLQLARVRARLQASPGFYGGHGDQALQASVKAGAPADARRRRSDDPLDGRRPLRRDARRQGRLLQQVSRRQHVRCTVATNPEADTAAQPAIPATRRSTSASARCVASSADERFGVVQNAVGARPTPARKW